MERRDGGLTRKAVGAEAPKGLYIKSRPGPRRVERLGQWIRKEAESRGGV